MLELQGQAFGTMRQTFGGDTLNTAVYLARCGAARGVRASYVTALGDDVLSDGLVRRWQDEGVGTQWVQRLAGRLPGLYLIEVDDRGERRFSYWRDRSAARSMFDAPTTPFEQALDTLDALYLSGISLAILPPAGRERLFGAMQRLRQRGGQVAFDSNFRPRLWPDRTEAQAAYRRAYAQCDLAFVSLDDHLALFGASGAQAGAADALALPPPELVLKRGAAPTQLRTAGSPVLEVATEAVRVVDTTAAGDAFAAGYLSRRWSGRSALEAARFGNRLAARVIQHPGAVIPADAMRDLMDASP